MTDDINVRFAGEILGWRSVGNPYPGALTGYPPDCDDHPRVLSGLPTEDLNVAMMGLDLMRYTVVLRSDEAEVWEGPTGIKLGGRLLGACCGRDHIEALVRARLEAGV